MERKLSNVIFIKPGERAWCVGTNVSSDSEWESFSIEEEARDYYASLVIELQDNPQNFGPEYTIQLWIKDELIDEFSLKEKKYKITSVWLGRYIGEDEWEGGTLDINFESNSDDIDELWNKLELAIKYGIKKGTHTQDDLVDLEYAEKLIFYLDDGTELVEHEL